MTAKPLNIVTEYWRKGRPGFNDPTTYDWEATEADYDPECDPTGYGSTEQEAKENLLELIQDRSEEAR